MDIAIYYQKWNAKEKNSHTLLEQAVRRYARENALLLPETLILASAEQTKKPRFQNAESIHFPYPIAEIGGAVPSALKKSGWISSRNDIAGRNVWPDVFIIHWK